VQAAILSLIVGSLFATIEVDPSDARQAMAVSTLSVMQMALFGLPQARGYCLVEPHV
jgi:hypothetical protein